MTGSSLSQSITALAPSPSPKEGSVAPMYSSTAKREGEQVRPLTPTMLYSSSFGRCSMPIGATVCQGQGTAQDSTERASGR